MNRYIKILSQLSIDCCCDIRQSQTKIIKQLEKTITFHLILKSVFNY